ncbi:MAG: PAS domain S-box protein [Candidatus Peribacteraceae bacterium]|nr:PAS domain S-box protein [Candidatus Peribacteraceae bacterium]
MQENQSSQIPDGLNDEQNLGWKSQHAAELFDLVSRNSNQLVYEYTPETGRILWTGAILEVTGYTPDEFAAIDINEWERHIHPDERVNADKALKEAQEKRRKFHMTYRFQRKDGSYVHIDDEGIFIFSEDGVRMVGTMKDVSERVRLEQEANASKDFLSSVLGNVTDPIFVKDDQHRWIMLNEAFCTFMGRSQEELIGKSDYDFFPKEQAKVFWEKDAEVFRTEKENTNEELFTDAKGVVHTIVTKKTIFTDSEGKKILVGIIRDITDRKEAEKNLITSQTKYKAIYEESSDAIMLLVPGKGFISGNPAAIALFGCKNEQEFTSFAPDQLSPETQPDGMASGIKSQQMMAIAMEKGSHLFEWRHKRADGKEFPAIVLLTRIEVEGKLILQATVRDITENKKMAEELAKKQEQLRLLLDSTAEAIYGIDLKGECTFCNAALLKMMGYAHQDELLGKNMHAMIHHSHADGTPFPAEQCRIFLAFRNGEGTHVNDEVLWRKDGTSFPAEYWSYPQRKDGKVIGSVVTFMDITEREKAEEELKRLAAIIASSDDAIIGKTLDGTIVDWNPGAEKTYGYTAGEALGQNITMLAPEGRQEEIRTLLQRIRDGDSVRQLETIRRRKDGREIPVSLSVFPITDEEKKIIGIATIAHDISALKQSEEELKNTKARLEEEVINTRKFLQAVENSSIATIIASPEPSIIYVNPAWEKLTGYHKEEVIGKNPRLLQSGQTPKTLYPQMWNAFCRGMNSSRRISSTGERMAPSSMRNCASIP